MQYRTAYLLFFKKNSVKDCFNYTTDLGRPLEALRPLLLVIRPLDYFVALFPAFKAFLVEVPAIEDDQGAAIGQPIDPVSAAPTGVRREYDAHFMNPSWASLRRRRLISLVGTTPA